ncbi:MAG TPA: hypothetical protein VHB53_12700 [Solirubrobacterales bacterium]|nr:hypothetical protein [Solirubrobacterales bacterium]
MGSAVLAMAVLLAACGGSSSDSNEKAGNYEVAVTGASFPPRQAIGQTSLMKIDVRNTGNKTIPALTVTVNVEGKEGESARLPFAVHDPQPGLAGPDRPVWVLAATYPRLAGSSEPGGAETSNGKTYSFGELVPGKSVEAVWKLSAVRAGKYTIGYEVEAGLTGEAKAETSSGARPGGTFVTDITTELPETEVNAAGEIVEIKRGEKKSSGG